MNDSMSKRVEELEEENKELKEKKAHLEIDIQREMLVANSNSSEIKSLEAKIRKAEIDLDIIHEAIKNNIENPDKNIVDQWNSLGLTEMALSNLKERGALQ